MRSKSPLIAFATLAAGPATAAPATDAEDRVVLGVGAFDGVEFDDASGEARLEYRSAAALREGLGADWFRGIAPRTGFLVNGDGGAFGWLYADLRLTPRIVFTPMGDIGGYASGDGKDLGGVFQSIVGSELADQFENRMRLGLYVCHLSNVGIHDDNPGTESVLMSVSLPLDRPF